MTEQSTRYAVTSQHVREQLGILQAFAPDGRAQQQCSEIVMALQRDSVQNREIVRQLAGIVHLGLTIGNWPWNTTPEAIRTALNEVG